MKNRFKLSVLALLFGVFFISISSLSAQTTTWNGTSWNNGDPSITLDAVFSANYTSTSDLQAKSVHITNNSQVLISDNNTFTIDGTITVDTGSSFIFENNSSLIQLNPSIVNTSSITFRRNSTPMKFFEYTYWSSPVLGQTLVDFSPLTSPSRYHSFNTTTNAWVNESPSNQMQAGRGYAIRSPDNFTSTAQLFNGEFKGPANNGSITTNVIAFNPALLNYNFIGNPYPSAINVISLLDNSNLGTLYFWTHNTTIVGNNFTTNDYAVRTRTTGTAAISGGVAPGLYIAAGQGFFASAATTTTLTFTNSMRVTNNNSQFYRSAQNTSAVPLNHYIHINLTNTQGAFKQIAIGYQEFATNDYDFGVDAFASTEGAITFYSIISPYTFGFGIQGRAYPWNINDVIDLGFNATIAGDYTIAIDHFDTFFSDKDIFIEDTLLGTYHNLKTNPYNFNTAVGVFNSRFKIHYQNLLSNTNEFIINPNAVIISNESDGILVNSLLEKIAKIQIYDTLGRLIFENKYTNQNKVLVESVPKNNQTLLMKMELANGQTISKKTVY